VRFIVDAQLPPALARMLVDLGHEAQHVVDLNLSLQAVDDSVIWDFALDYAAVLLTKDDNFPHRFHQSVHTPVVVWLRVGNVSRQALLRWFRPLLPQVIKIIEEENRLIELR
jgi:predicted nuclease of predicted toxin-antitoxin system